MYCGSVYVIFVVMRKYHSLWPYHVDIDEMPYVNRIYNLCLAIYQVRAVREFSLEEDLYAKLLFLLRSTEVRIFYTRYPEHANNTGYLRWTTNENEADAAPWDRPRIMAD